MSHRSPSSRQLNLLIMNRNFQRLPPSHTRKKRLPAWAGNVIDAFRVIGKYRITASQQFFQQFDHLHAGQYFFGMRQATVVPAFVSKFPRFFDFSGRLNDVKQLTRHILCMKIPNAAEYRSAITRALFCFKSVTQKF